METTGNKIDNRLRVQRVRNFTEAVALEIRGSVARDAVPDLVSLVYRSGACDFQFAMKADEARLLAVILNKMADALDGVAE